MFEYNHYVPILRWKRGEQIALKNLFENDRPHITPLIELVPGDFTSEKIQKAGNLKNKLIKTSEQFESCLGKSDFFVDLINIPKILASTSGKHFFEVLNKNGLDRGLHMIPVTGLRRSDRYQASIKSIIEFSLQGICLRIYLNDINQPSFREDIKYVLSYFNLTPNNTHLLIDLRIVDENYPQFSLLCKNLPFLEKWKSFTVSSGSFPKDLSELEKNRQHEITRQDWLNWLQQTTNKPKLPRIPTYSDYTIQHPIFSEPPDFPNISASIRYTADDYWVIIRGEGLNNPEGQGYDQYPAEADFLRALPEYRGSNFSYGDKYIYERASNPEKTGNPETWIRAGVNHHLTFAVRQIANHFGF